MHFPVLSHCRKAGLWYNNTYFKAFKSSSYNLSHVPVSGKLNKTTPNLWQKNFTTSAGSILQSKAYALTNIETTFIEKLNLLPPAEFKSFINAFPDVVNDLVTLPEFALMTETNDWVKQVILHNVPHGKLLRPILLLAVARQTQDMTGKDLPNLNKIAWSYEFLQGYATIHDDMMDGSETRRGQPCWYLVENTGQSAINDGDILENAAYVLLKKYASGIHPLYADILDTLHESFLKLLFGQSLDGRISQNKYYHMLTRDVYTKMMGFKNSYYTFYAPICIGLLLNGINTPATLKCVESTSLKLGLLYSIQDDFIDCFVDPEKSGKIGTDIQDGKPSWLIVSALDQASENQRQVLMDNFGKMDPENVAKVKNIYIEMNLPALFAEYEKTAVSNILSDIDNLPEIIPKKPLLDIVNMLNGRTQ